MKLIQVGKTKEIWLKSALEEYHKRISPYSKLQIIEIKEEKADPKNPTVAMKKEGDKIIAHIKNDDYIIALDSRGTQLTSEELAKKLKQITISPKKSTFIIGGPYGLHTNVIKKANLLLSLSKMTLTHQMARLFITEQIYRACMICKGKKYHK